MMKRSVLLALAAGLIASVAFTAPAQAGGITAFFSLSPAGATTSEIDFFLQDSLGNAPASISGPFTTKNTGGLTNLSYSTNGTDEIIVKFDAANHTNGTIGPPPTPGLQFHFAWTLQDDGNDGRLFGKHMDLVLTPGTTAAQSFSVTPEPSSWALLGIGMTGFLAFRRFFKKTSVA